MNLANIITAVRLVFSPLVFAAILKFNFSGWDGWRIIALVLFAAGCLSDIIDGYIARRSKCITKTGAVLDGIADKFLNGLAILAIAGSRNVWHVALWYPVIIVIKELAIGALTASVWGKMPSTGFKPLKLGRISAVLQSATIIWLLLLWPRDRIVYTVSGGVAALAILAYVYAWITFKQKDKDKWEPLPETKD